MFNITMNTGWTTLPNGIEVFARSAGPQDGNTVLLLHGFPSSSHQFRNLIPILATHGLRVIAPDLPGFGFTRVPIDLAYTYTFESLTMTIATYLDIVGVKEFAVYIFDYGAPVGLRLALQRPSAVKAIISQNGNAYEEGLLPFWDPLKQLWTTDPGSEEDKILRRKISDAILTYDATKAQYLTGEPKPETIDPASWTLDSTLLEGPGNRDIQLGLFRDYATNVVLYPKFQEYFRSSQVPLLAVWGKNDFIFGHPELFKKDLPNAQVESLDGGHFLVESHTEILGKRITEFLKKINFCELPQ